MILPTPPSPPRCLLKLARPLLAVALVGTFAFTTLSLTGCGRTQVIGEKAPRKKGMLAVQQCPPPFEGSRMKIKLLPGVYECDLIISGERNVVKGYGVNRTIIEGNLIIEGHRNKIVGLRVTKSAIIVGDGNRLGKNHYGEGVQDQGVNNRY